MKFRDIISFLTFSNIAGEKKIEQQLHEHHSGYQSLYTYWSVSATKRKLIASFWFDSVFKHYVFVCLLALLFVSFINYGFWNHLSTLLAILILLVLIFIPLAAFIYFPFFYASYLPLLESSIENYTGKQLESIHKCKKEQYSVMGLMIIQYTLHHLAGIHCLSTSAQHANILMKQYGVSSKMIDNTLRAILFNNWDNKKERKRTEIMEAFDEARDYFDTFHAEKAIRLLEELQQKMLLQTVRVSKPLKAVNFK